MIDYASFCHWLSDSRDRKCNVYPLPILSWTEWFRCLCSEDKTCTEGDVRQLKISRQIYHALCLTLPELIINVGKETPCQDLKAKVEQEIKGSGSDGKKSMTKKDTDRLRLHKRRPNELFHCRDQRYYPFVICETHMKTRRQIDAFSYNKRLASQFAFVFTRKSESCSDWLGCYFGKYSPQDVGRWKQFSVFVHDDHLIRRNWGKKDKKKDKSKGKKSKEKVH